MIAYILRTNRMTYTAWSNVTAECKRALVADYLRHLQVASA